MKHVDYCGRISLPAAWRPVTSGRASSWKNILLWTLHNGISSYSACIRQLPQTLQLNYDKLDFGLSWITTFVLPVMLVYNQTAMLTMEDHVSNVASSCFYWRRRLHQILFLVSHEVTLQIEQLQLCSECGLELRHNNHKTPATLAVSRTIKAAPAISEQTL